MSNGRGRITWPGQGWRLRRPVREVSIGLLAFPMVFAFASWLDGTLQRLGVPGPARAATFLQPDATAGQLLTAAVLVGVVAVAEESVFRGYLDFLQDFTAIVVLAAFRH